MATFRVINVFKPYFQLLATSLLTFILLFLVADYVRDTSLGRRMYGRGRSLIKEWTGIHRLGLAEEQEETPPGHNYNNWSQHHPPGHNPYWQQPLLMHGHSIPSYYHPITVWPPAGAGLFYSRAPVGIWLVIQVPKPVEETYNASQSVGDFRPSVSI